MQESIVKLRVTLVLVALSAASAIACAQSAGRASLAREEVVRQVLEARAKGVLRRAGEPGPRGDEGYAADVATPSTLTRSQQSDLVPQARNARELAHAGPTAPERETAALREGTSTRAPTRADVQRQVREALADTGPHRGGAGEFPDVPHRRSHFANVPDAADRTVVAREK